MAAIKKLREINFRKKRSDYFYLYYLFIIFILFSPQVRSNYRNAVVITRVTYLWGSFFSLVAGWCNFTKKNFFTDDSTTSRKQEVLCKKIDSQKAVLQCSCSAGGQIP